MNDHVFETTHDGSFCIYCGEPEYKHNVSEPTPRENLKPSISGELKQYIEANFLDGEKVQPGQLISAVEVVEWLEEYLPQKVNAEVLAVLDEMWEVSRPYSPEAKEPPYWIREAIIQLKQRYGGKEQGE